MILFMRAIDRQAQHRDFTCQFDQLEMVFEFLSSIVAEGDTLLDAYVVDKNEKKQLPIQAFDGAPFLMAMTGLEQEWKAILKPEDTPSPINYELIHLTEWRVRLSENRLAIHTDTIDQLKELLERTQQILLPGGRKDYLINRYQALIHSKQLELIQAQVCHRFIVERLAQLIG